MAAEDLLSAVRALGFDAAGATDGAGSHALWAGDGDRQLGAVIGGDGALEMDFQGFDGTDCVAVQNALVDALRAQGWDLALVDQVLHWRRTGGALITAAARIARERECAPQEALLAAGAPVTVSDDSPARMHRFLAHQRARQRVR